MVLPHLFVAPSGSKGRGVYTSKRLQANTIVEISPVLVFTAKERKILEDTKLFDYIFEWGESNTQAGLGLGYISLYNHSYDANCDYEMDYEHMLMTIKTIKLINKGSELCINYNAIPDDKTRVWFHQ